MIKINTPHDDYQYVNHKHIVKIMADYCGTGNDQGSVITTTGGDWITSTMSRDEVFEAIRWKGEK